MKNLLSTALFAFIAIGYVHASSTHSSLALETDKPENVGMSSARLARLDAMGENAVKDGDIPGAVVLVARKGKIVYYKAFGKADNESGRDLRRDDIFRIASQTKAITSTAVMILWEEGKFRLDDPISKYIPEFKDPQVLDTFNEEDGTYTTIPADKEITIRHLITHTSGIGYGGIDSDDRIKAIYSKAGVTDLFTTKNISIEQSVKKLAKLPLHHNLGEKFTYSEGLDVLGYFVEVMSGMPFDAFLRTRIFEPLGMEDTWFYLPKDKARRLVSIQEKKDGEWTRYPVTFYDPDYPIKGARCFFSGGAGLSSTAKDYATFLQMYLNEGKLNGVRILSRTTIQSMMGNQSQAIFGDKGENGKYYGLAFGVLNQRGQDMAGRGSVGTFDWGGYFNTQYFADPKEQVIGIIMKQTRGPTTDDTGWQYPNSSTRQLTIDNAKASSPARTGFF